MSWGPSWFRVSVSTVKLGVTSLKIGFWVVLLLILQRGKFEIRGPAVQLKGEVHKRFRRQMFI